MTLGEAKIKARKLMDEYSLNGQFVPETSKSVADYMLKMNDLFDVAQKEAAQVKPIVRAMSISKEPGAAAVYELPEDYYKLRAVFILDSKGRRQPTARFELAWPSGLDGRAGITLPQGGGAYIVEYCAYPEGIGPETGDGHLFEVAPDAQEALPYFVAASCIQHENQALFATLYGMYQTKLINLAPVSPPAGGIRQTFFG